MTSSKTASSSLKVGPDPKLKPRRVSSATDTKPPQPKRPDATAKGARMTSGTDGVDKKSTQAGPVTFLLKYHPAARHYVTVKVFKTRAAMRRYLAGIRYQNGVQSEASTWQQTGSSLIIDGCVCEMLFYRGSGLSTENMVHECFHACFHRARIIGYPLCSVDFEECIAYDMERLFVSLEKEVFKRRLTDEP